MKSFWKESYDGNKDRRYGMLFLGTLLGFLGAVALGGMVYGIIGADNFQNYVVPTLPGFALLLIALIWQSTRRAWKRQREKLKNAELSRDELLKARSKLRNGMNPPRLPAVSLPDIDLKY